MLRRVPSMYNGYQDLQGPIGLHLDGWEAQFHHAHGQVEAAVGKTALPAACMGQIPCCSNPYTICTTFPCKNAISDPHAPCFACAWDGCMGGAWVAQWSCRDEHSSDSEGEHASRLAGSYTNILHLQVCDPAPWESSNRVFSPDFTPSKTHLAVTTAQAPCITVPSGFAVRISYNTH